MPLLYSGLLDRGVYLQICTALALMDEIEYVQYRLNVSQVIH